MIRASVAAFQPPCPAAVTLAPPSTHSGRLRRWCTRDDEGRATISEYQYYEFVAVDHALDDAQMMQLRALSTRAQITPTGFVNTYHWGNLAGDPQTMVERYFDAFFYDSNGEPDS